MQQQILIDLKNNIKRKKYIIYLITKSRENIKSSKKKIWIIL